MQTSSRGGAAHTEATAVAVRPNRSPSSAVVITQTDDTCCATAAM